jgi:glucose-specific phosphotransferase system IIA component
MPDVLSIAAPFHGTVAAMSLVPDEVFAQNIVGPGVALVPFDDADVVEVLAPLSGTITAVFPHAFSIDAGNDVNVLVHLGIDTVTLQGAGFVLHASVGQDVTVGDLLIEWRPRVAREAGLSVMCPLVAVQAEDSDVRVLADESAELQPGAPLLEWSPGA